MFEDMIRLLDGLNSAGTPIEKRGCWCPPVDVYRTGQGWLVKFELAGINPKEIQIQRRGRRLTVRGMRRDALVQQGAQSYSLEINYNRFERSVEMPADIESHELKSEYRDGMLLIWLNQSNREK